MGLRFLRQSGHFKICVATALVLSACGGSAGQSGTTINRSLPVVEDDVTQTTAQWSITGNIVKGPVAFARVTLHGLDTTLPGFYDARAALANGHTDANAALQDIAFSTSKTPPFVLVADATAGIDLNTGQAPVLTTLINVITQDMLDSRAPVYATPLTTLAFWMAVDATPANAGVARFLAALSSAATILKDALPIAIPDSVDVLRDPPVLTDATTSAAAQHAVAQHRAAIEALAATLYQTRLANGTDNDTLLLRLARDIRADNIMDGVDNGTMIDGLDSTILTRDPFTLTVPNTQITVDQVGVLLSQDLDYLDTHVNIDRAALTVTTRTEMAGSENALRLSWGPSAGFVQGYIVYKGPTAQTASDTVVALDIARGDIDQGAPAVTLNTSALGINPGEMICFRARAYNGAGLSDPSEAVCAVL